MSSPLLPIPGPLGHAAPPSATAAGDACAFASELYGSSQPLDIAAARGGPPRHVLEQMLAAGFAFDRLRESGRDLNFAAPAPGQPLAIELHDGRGSVRSLSAAEAIDLACGKRQD